MHKKLMLACMAIAAFAAFVVAPAASAANLTENGVTIKAGASITGTNTGITEFEAGELTVKCDHDHLSGTVTKDENGTIAGEIPIGNAHFYGTGGSTDCTSPLGDTYPEVNTKLCLHIAKGVDTGTIDGCGKAITFTLKVTGIVTCAYKTAETGITGTVTTGTGTVAISKQPAARETINFLCPAEGKLNMVFDLFTTDGTALVVS